MNIIAESSTTRTEWALVDGERVIEHAFTTGVNPFFQTRREISHIIRLELPEAFFKRRWDHIHFYGAGCSNQEKIKIMESSLVAQFKTPVTVNSDLLGAARGLLVHRPGLACILGTGSNSCLYDGEEIVKNVAALGFILGDEGSNAYMGKKLIADILKDITPIEIREAFYDKYQVAPNVLLDEVYSSVLPQRQLSKYVTLLRDHLDHPYVYDLVYRSFMKFFKRNISHYDYTDNPICFVGSTCVMFEDVLRKVATDFGAQIEKVTKYSLPGLIEYHADLK
ncbi:MAG: hypothetical protein J1F20_06755 [Muribaculaceae bacterium]|nr:hypothetical protein [Muribaculaceae bacterium]